ncbi:MAG: hypothetical protein EXQ94_12545 [Alphaproteobacteria bacterium]|nr:hypothetical protein [Alphaproteobacteria bacterium]
MSAPILPHGCGAPKSQPVSARPDPRSRPGTSRATQGHRPPPIPLARPGASATMSQPFAGGPFVEREQRRLAAILAADVVGYSRLMAADESGTLARFKLLRSDHVEPALRRHGSRVVGEAGDSLLVEFGAASDAVTCAVEVQAKLAELNAELPDDRRMRFRMGVNLGEVIVDGATIHGDGVNIAARLEKLAEPGGLVISGTVHDHVKGRVAVRFEDLGNQTLHNIAEPVRALRIVSERTAAQGRTLNRDDRATVAVLPFTNMSGDPEQEYFSDGITEDLITALARIQDISVIARNSTFTYKGKAVKVQDVGSDLGARLVIEGSVRKSGNRVRITAQLIDAENGAHLWAERYDRDLVDAFAIQDEVVTAIAGHLGFRFADALSGRQGQAPTPSLSTYDHGQRGAAAFRRGDEIASQYHFLQAIRSDPGYAPALAGAAILYSYSLFSGRYRQFRIGAVETAEAVEVETRRYAERVRPGGFDVEALARCYARLSRRPEDAEHWGEGFRKAGLIN